jgi:hypothetical protein
MFSLTAKEKDFLEALIKNQVRFMIVGLSSAVLQNAHLVTQDIDLWIEDLGSDDFKKAVSEVSGFFVPAGLVGLNPPMLGPDFLKVFDLVSHLHGLKSFAEEYSGAITMEAYGLKLKLLPLERIIASKEAANREKDRVSLPVLRAALALKLQ